MKQMHLQSKEFFSKKFEFFKKYRIIGKKVKI